jgi:hypothetical protein
MEFKPPITQEDIDVLIALVKETVRKVGKGSPRLHKLEEAYTMLYRCPGDPGAYTLVLMEIKRLGLKWEKGLAFLGKGPEDR